MYSKSLLVSLGAILAAIIIQALYLKALPGSLVRVYYTEDVDDFNKPPAADMTVLYGGYVFDYRMPLSISEGDSTAIKEVMQDRKQADMTMLTDIAAWVRTKMSLRKQ